MTMAVSCESCGMPLAGAEAHSSATRQSPTAATARRMASSSPPRSGWSASPSGRCARKARLQRGPREGARLPQVDAGLEGRVLESVGSRANEGRRRSGGLDYPARLALVPEAHRESFCRVIPSRPAGDIIGPASFRRIPDGALMPHMDILGWIVVGFLAGALSGAVVERGPHGCLANTAVGVLGGILGGWFATEELHMDSSTASSEPCSFRSSAR